MKKMVSVILLSVLLLGLCGTVFEIRPTSANESAVSYQTLTAKSEEELVYQSPFIPRSGTRPESDSSGMIKDNSNETSSQGPVENMPYYEKKSIGVTLLNE